MITHRVHNGKIGVSTNSYNDPPNDMLIILQVEHGETAENFQQARCSMTIQETKNLISQLEEIIK